MTGSLDRAREGPRTRDRLINAPACGVGSLPSQVSWPGTDAVPRSRAPAPGGLETTANRVPPQPTILEKEGRPAALACGPDAHSNGRTVRARTATGLRRLSRAPERGKSRGRVSPSAKRPRSCPPTVALASARGSPSTIGGSRGPSPAVIRARLGFHAGTRAPVEPLEHVRLDRLGVAWDRFSSFRAGPRASYVPRFHALNRLFQAHVT